MMKNKTFNLLLTTIGCFWCNFMHAKVIVYPNEEGVVGKEQVAAARQKASQKELDEGHFELASGTRCIAESAFKDCPLPIKVTLAKTDDGETIPLQKIGKQAFMECPNLKTVDIPALIIGEQAFYKCEKLSNVTLPLQEIGKQAFMECSQLKTVDIPALIIGEQAFYKCEELSKVTLSANLEEIWHSAFGQCTKLKEIEWPNKNNIKAMGQGIFCSCTALESIQWPKNLQSIPGYTFSNCMSLKTIELQEGLRSINDCAFLRCTSLRKIEVPKTVHTISLGAFRECRALREFRWPEASCPIFSEEPLLCFGAFWQCSSLQTVMLPPNIMAMGPGVFAGCTALKTIQLPRDLKEISMNLFHGCMSLRSINGSKKVNKIGSEAFKGCCQLNPGPSAFPNVTEMGFSAFEGCTALQNGDFPKLKSVPCNAFKDCTHITEIYCPLAEEIRWGAFEGTNITKASFSRQCLVEQNAFPYITKPIAWNKGDKFYCDLNPVAAKDTIDASNLNENTKTLVVNWYAQNAQTGELESHWKSEYFYTSNAIQ